MSEAAPNRRFVLGIDPGLKRTGYAVLAVGPDGVELTEAGVIRSTGALSLDHRVGEIGAGLAEIVEEYRFSSAAIEQVFSHQNFPRAALIMAHARGVILYTLHRAGVPLASYAPRQMKKLLTGAGTASKDQVQLAVQRELGLESILEPNDAADAAAMALCHHHTERLRAMRTVIDGTPSRVA